MNRAAHIENVFFRGLGMFPNKQFRGGQGDQKGAVCARAPACEIVPGIYRCPACNVYPEFVIDIASRAAVSAASGCGVKRTTYFRFRKLGQSPIPGNDMECWAVLHL